MGIVCQKLEKGKSLSLTNSGDLQIFFIGTGSAFATKLNQSNFLIIKGDTHILVDFGMSGPKALPGVAGLKLTDILTCLPTHSHGDHVNGIEALALLNRYVGRKFMQKEKIKMIITEEYERILWDCTLRGALEYNEETIDSKRRLALVDYFEIVRPEWKTHQPREIFEINFNGINIELFRTKHIPDTAKDWGASFISYGLFIDNKILISGDTRYDADLLEYYGGRAEYIFHDVQFFPGGVHANFDDFVDYPKEWKSKTYFYHYPDNYREHDKKIKDYAGWVKQGHIYTFY